MTKLLTSLPRTHESELTEETSAIASVSTSPARASHRYTFGRGSVWSDSRVWSRAYLQRHTSDVSQKPQKFLYHYPKACMEKYERWHGRKGTQSQHMCAWWIPNPVLENLLSCPVWSVRSERNGERWGLKQWNDLMGASYTRSYLVEGRHQQSLPFGRVLLAEEIVLALGRLHGVSAEPGNSSDPYCFIHAGAGATGPASFTFTHDEPADSRSSATRSKRRARATMASPARCSRAPLLYLSLCLANSRVLC